MGMPGIAKTFSLLLYVYLAHDVTNWMLENPELAKELKQKGIISQIPKPIYLSYKRDLINF